MNQLKRRFHFTILALNWLFNDTTLNVTAFNMTTYHALETGNTYFRNDLTCAQYKSIKRDKFIYIRWIEITYTRF